MVKRVTYEAVTSPDSRALPEMVNKVIRENPNKKLFYASPLIAVQHPTSSSVFYVQAMWFMEV